jgi:nitrite reductase (NADH) small subunit
MNTQEYLVGRVEDFDDHTRRLITVDGIEVGVISYRERFYAYRNWCVHQGGPICEGMISGRVEEVVGDDGRVLGGLISDEVIHIACPWHGYVFDLETGECIVERGKRLRAYEVRERDGNVYVVI